MNDEYKVRCYKIDDMVDILAEALIASVSNKKIIVICRDNEIKEKLLKVAREYGVESAIEIQVLRHDIGKRAEDVIIDEFEEVTHNED